MNPNTLGLVKKRCSGLEELLFRPTQGGVTRDCSVKPTWGELEGLLFNLLRGELQGIVVQAYLGVVGGVFIQAYSGGSWRGCCSGLLRGELEGLLFRPTQGGVGGVVV